jgi:mono/diheme cytochrome c family protein
MRKALLAFGMLASVALYGCKAKPPAKVEAHLMWGLKHRVLVGGKKQSNPLATTPQTIVDGKEAFSHYCVACHGLDGQNTGVPFADRLSPPVPSLSSQEVQQYSDGQLKWVIDNGIWPSGMPGSSGILSDDEMWSIVIYIRNLPKAGSLGDPPMYNQ